MGRRRRLEDMVGGWLEGYFWVGAFYGGEGGSWGPRGESGGLGVAGNIRSTMVRHA